MTYRTEFPGFVLGNIEIPAGFVDQSWKNDACPSWQNDFLRLRLWIDFEKPEERDADGARRFLLQTITRWDDDSPETIYDGDKYATVLELVASRASHMRAFVGEGAVPEIPAALGHGGSELWRVVEWYHQLADRGIVCHPDDEPNGIVCGLARPLTVRLFDIGAARRYAEQLVAARAIYDAAGADIYEIALQAMNGTLPLSFEEFHATKTWCEDLGSALNDSTWDDGAPGRGNLYLGCLHIELTAEPLTMEDMSERPVWRLVIGRNEWDAPNPPRFVEDLNRVEVEAADAAYRLLERRLYDFAISEGYADRPARA
jgi:hypothetical protein